MKKMRGFILIIACVVAVGPFFCESVYAADNKHDGFFLRLAPGIGASPAPRNLAVIRGKYLVQLDILTLV
jgi:hypothetical protein